MWVLIFGARGVVAVLIAMILTSALPPNSDFQKLVHFWTRGVLWLDDMILYTGLGQHM